MKINKPYNYIGDEKLRGKAEELAKQVYKEGIANTDFGTLFDQVETEDINLAKLQDLDDITVGDKEGFVVDNDVDSQEISIEFSDGEIETYSYTELNKLINKGSRPSAELGSYTPMGSSSSEFEYLMVTKKGDKNEGKIGLNVSGRSFNSTYPQVYLKFIEDGYTYSKVYDKTEVTDKGFDAYGLPNPPDDAILEDGGALDKEFKFDKNFVIYVPSTTNVGSKINPTEMDVRVNSVGEFVADKFGGFTKTETDGGYKATDGDIIEEDIVKVSVFAKDFDWDKHEDEVVTKVKEWAKKWGQEAIGFEYEGKLYYIDEEGKFMDGGEIEESLPYTATFKEGGKILTQNDIRYGMIIPSKKYPNRADKVIGFTDKAVKVQSVSPSENNMGSKFGYGMKPYTYRWDGTGYKRQNQYLHSDGIYRIESYAEGGEVMFDHDHYGYSARVPYKGSSYLVEMGRDWNAPFRDVIVSDGMIVVYGGTAEAIYMKMLKDKPSSPPKYDKGGKLDDKHSKYKNLSNKNVEMFRDFGYGEEKIKEVNDRQGRGSQFANTPVNPMFNTYAEGGEVDSILKRKIERLEEKISGNENEYSDHYQRYGTSERQDMLDEIKRLKSRLGSTYAEGGEIENLKSPIKTILSFRENISFEKGDSGDKAMDKIKNAKTKKALLDAIDDLEGMYESDDEMGMAISEIKSNKRSTYEGGGEIYVKAVQIGFDIALAKGVTAKQVEEFFEYRVVPFIDNEYRASTKGQQTMYVLNGVFSAEDMTSDYKAILEEEISDDETTYVKAIQIGLDIALTEDMTFEQVEQYAQHELSSFINGYDDGEIYVLNGVFSAEDMTSNYKDHFKEINSYAEGGEISGYYSSIHDFVERNNLEAEADKVFGEGWEADDDMEMIRELAGVNYDVGEIDYETERDHRADDYIKVERFEKGGSTYAEGGEITLGEIWENGESIKEVMNQDDGVTITYKYKGKEYKIRNDNEGDFISLKGGNWEDNQFDYNTTYYQYNSTYAEGGKMFSAKQYARLIDAERSLDGIDKTADVKTKIGEITGVNGSPTGYGKLIEVNDTFSTFISTPSPYYEEYWKKGEWNDGRKIPQSMLDDWEKANKRVGEKHTLPTYIAWNAFFFEQGGSTYAEGGEIFEYKVKQYSKNHTIKELSEIQDKLLKTKNKSKAQQENLMAITTAIGVKRNPDFYKDKMSKGGSTYAEGGEVEMIEIAEDGRNVPPQLMDIFSEFNEDEDPYKEMEKLRARANEIGYDFSYGLDGTPTEFCEIPKKSWGGGIAIGTAVGGYVGYKIGRARPEKRGFETEKKIGKKIGKAFSKGKDKSGKAAEKTKKWFQS